MGHSEGMIHDDRKVKWYDSVLHAIIYYIDYLLLTTSLQDW